MNPANQTHEQIQRIREKFVRLKERDRQTKTFGARQHKFSVNPPLDPDTVQKFEDTYSIELPDEYKQFLQEFGDGGAGPAYGLKTLAEGLYADLDFPDKENLVDPSLPFPHTEPQMMLNEMGEIDPPDEVERRTRRPSVCLQSELCSKT